DGDKYVDTKTTTTGVNADYEWQTDKWVETVKRVDEVITKYYEHIAEPETPQSKFDTIYQGAGTQTPANCYNLSAYCGAAHILGYTSANKVTQTGQAGEVTWNTDTQEWEVSPATNNILTITYTYVGIPVPPTTPATFATNPVFTATPTTPTAVLAAETTKEPASKGEVLGAHIDKRQWALVNLLLAISTALASLTVIVLYFTGKKNDEDEKVKRHGAVRTLSLVPAVGAVVAFILTEDMALKMGWVDKWTILMVAIAAVQIVLLVLARRKQAHQSQA
ncbi:hypothetical protein FWF48_03945, partial [Candidatus Saccharibacteria bacterium]|nr:hypothetical protein [Candidatus Saccharibacteria bacterium]